MSFFIVMIYKSRIYMLKLFFTLIFTVFVLASVSSQTVMVHLTEVELYDFIDELANEKIIELNSIVKPYSRKQVYNWLISAATAQGLSARQKKQINFYLREYGIQSTDSINPYGSSNLNLIGKWTNKSAMQLNQLGYFYKDNLLTFSLKPIWGIDYKSNDSGTVRHFWGGLSAQANIGSHWGIYASLRDNSITEILTYPSTISMDDGGNYKVGEGGRPGGDYSEMRGGITYSWGWGDIGLIKDHVSVGNNYHGANILSGRAPSYAMIKLHMNPAKWFDFNYHHGWLVSEDVDSARSYYSTAGTYKAVFREKFLATNMFTFKPWKGVNFSFGNSIVYTDLGGPHPAYLIPVMFFKSIDHTLNHGIENQNSQMFTDMSIRKIKHLHLYGTLYLDEFKKERISVDSLHNFFSFKTGARLSNWPLKNVSITLEFTRTSAMTYKHTVAGLSYASNKYGLGHYLGDNSQETYLSIDIKPIPRLYIKAEYFYAMHGDDYVYNFLQGYNPTSIPIVENLTWSNHSFGFYATYELLNDVYMKFYYTASNIKGFDQNGLTAQDYLDKFTPVFYQGKKKTLGFGFNMGF